MSAYVYGVLLAALLTMSGYAAMLDLDLREAKSTVVELTSELLEAEEVRNKHLAAMREAVALILELEQRSKLYYAIIGSKQCVKHMMRRRQCVGPVEAALAHETIGRRP